MDNCAMIFRHKREGKPYVSKESVPLLTKNEEPTMPEQLTDAVVRFQSEKIEEIFYINMAHR